MLEMTFNIVDEDRVGSLWHAYDTLVDMAKNVGFITTKVVNDKLKPDLVSGDLLISDKNWWSYKEFKEDVMSLDGPSPSIYPGSLILRFPQYHTGPYPTTGIVDGGKRMSFGEGLAEREPADGKGRYDLITPFGIRRLAIWYELGAKKYADRNWEKGMPFSRYIDAAKRHLDKYIMGMTDEDHLAAAAWNILSIMHHEELGQMEFDDMPHYMSDESQKERLKKQLNALYGMKEEEKDHE